MSLCQPSGWRPVICQHPTRILLHYLALTLWITLCLASTAYGAQSCCAVLVHATDSDTPPHTAAIIQGLSAKGFNTTVLCGTRECHEKLAGLRNTKTTIRMLRVARLVKDTPLHGLFSNQEALSLLRVKLQGHRFEYAVSAVAALAALVHTESCACSLYLNHFWDGFLDPERKTLSESRLQRVLNYSAPTAALDNRNLAALWLPRGDYDVPHLQMYMRRVDEIFRMVPRQELLVPAPADGWLEQVFCGLGDQHPRVRCISSGADGSFAGGGSGQWYDKVTRTFHAIGYAGGPGCPEAGGKVEFYEGDQFMTIAALQYLPRVDSFIDVRVDLGIGLYTTPCKDIAGELQWPAQPSDGGQAYVFMAARWNRLGLNLDSKTGGSPGWPPPDHIVPVLVGFRYDNDVKWGDPMVQWFKRWGLVGARDTTVMRMLDNNGVSSIHVGCVTLGLRTWICPTTTAQGKAVQARLHVHSIHRQNSILLNTSAVPAVVFYNPVGICANGPHNMNVVAGVPLICGLRHIWTLKDKPVGEAFGTYDLGTWYDLQTHAGRLQLCFNKLRAIKRASMVITNPVFHVIMPSVGLGVPPLVFNPHNVDNRWDGMVGLYTSVPLDESAPAAARAQSIERAVAAVRALHPDSNSEWCEVDGKLTAVDPHPRPDRALRDELYRRQLWLLSKRAPILDAMNRLGVVDALMDDAEAADDAWIRGELPKVLWPLYVMNRTSASF